MSKKESESGKRKGGNQKLNLKEKLDEDNLDLSLCTLDSVPVKEISELSKVRKLNLSFNSLTFLPEDFVKLQNIKELDLSKNKLRSLPDNFGQLVNLKSLDLLGNELVSLPLGFHELRSLQWLDLKDNPLEPSLAKVAGLCLDEQQCKKCALNVLKYMKEMASEHERKRQIELKKKKDQQLKLEALEKEKAKEQKNQKMLEREQRRLVYEQRKLENAKQDSTLSHVLLEANGQHKTARQSAKGVNKKPGWCRSVFSSLFYLLLGVLFVSVLYLTLFNYCNTLGKHKPQTNTFLSNEYVKTVLGQVEQHVCPHLKRNHLKVFTDQVPYVDQLLKSLNLI